VLAKDSKFETVLKSIEAGLAALAEIQKFLHSIGDSDPKQIVAERTRELEALRSGLELHAGGDQANAPRVRKPRTTAAPKRTRKKRGLPEATQAPAGEQGEAGLGF
jgi:hypothetical protein